jgi:hypothetical protein
MKINETLVCQIKTVLGAEVEGWKWKAIIFPQLGTSPWEIKLREGKIVFRTIS